MDEVFDRRFRRQQPERRVVPRAAFAAPFGVHRHRRRRFPRRAAVQAVHQRHVGHGRRGTRFGVDVDRRVGGDFARRGIVVRAPRPQHRRRHPRHVDLGLLAAQVDRQLAAADRQRVARIQRIDEFRAVGLADLRVHELVAVLQVDRHQRFFFVIDPAEGVGPVAPALLERAARQARMGGARRVQRRDVLVERGIRRRQLVALRRAGLESLVEQAFALPVAVIRIVGRRAAAVVVAALIERVLGAVVQARHRRGQIKEAQRGTQLPDVVARVAAVHQGDAVQVVVVNERHQPVRPLAVLALVVELLRQLPRPAVVHEHALDRLADGEKQRGVEGIARVLAEARQRVVVVAEQLAEENEIVLAAVGRVLAHVVRPLLDPVVFHVLDRIHAEAVAVRRVNQVLERLRQDVLHRRVLGLEVVRALELPQQVLRRAVPAVDRPVVVEVGQVVERRGVLVVLVPPAERAVAVGEILLVVLLVVAPQPVLVAHVVRRHVENHIDAGGVQRVNQFLQVLEGPHRRIALEEVFGVVLVIRRVIRVLALVVHLHAGHPHRLHTHARQIADVVLHPLPVAAVMEVAVLRKTLALGFPPRLVGRQLVVARVRETIREELVDVDVAPVLRTRRVAEPFLVLPGLQSVRGVVHPPVPDAALLRQPRRRPRHQRRQNAHPPQVRLQ